MKQQGAVAVQGGIGNRNINIQNVKNIQNVSRGGRGDSDNNNEALPKAFAIGLFIFGAIVAAAVYYLRYFDEVFLGLNIATIVPLVIYAMIFIREWRAPRLTDWEIGYVFIGVIVSCVQFWTAMTAESAIPHEMVMSAKQTAIAAHSLSWPIDFWKLLGGDLQKLLLSNFGSAVLLTFAILTNLLFALRKVMEGIDGNEQSLLWSALLKGLRIGNISSIWVSILFTAASYALASQLFFNLIALAIPTF